VYTLPGLWPGAAEGHKKETRQANPTKTMQKWLEKKGPVIPTFFLSFMIHLHKNFILQLRPSFSEGTPWEYDFPRVDSPEADCEKISLSPNLTNATQ
jgi:hypothetical protein